MVHHGHEVEAHLLSPNGQAGDVLEECLRRDPRDALFVPSDDVFVWAGFDGRVELTEAARDPHDDVADQLVDYYRRGNGEHEDWEAYRAAMVADHRLIGTFVATSATGILPD